MYSDMNITLFYIPTEVRYENQSRVTRLSRSNNRQPDRKQMEAADPAESARQTVAIQRAEKKSLDGISQKVLTDSLRSMEEDCIITRTVYPEVPPRVEYALSDLGESMRPIIKSMETFGIDYKEQFEK